MTTFTFSFDKRIVRGRSISAVVVLIVVALMLTAIMASADRRPPATEQIAAAWRAAADRDAAAAARVAEGLNRSERDLLSTLHVNFDLATRGATPHKSRLVAMPRHNSAGLVCNPAVLDRKSTFRIVLPTRRIDREGVLAALTPEGNLRIIYQSYGSDVESVDLIIPSNAITWQGARSHYEFAIDVAKFDALREGKDVSEPLFQQSGVYQIALLNGTDREWMADGDAPFWVIAGCVVRWQP